ncbi:MAG: hypothetical protein IPM50_05490 [Acidobacteriota bacterium]|nr:MAG: hypothetical protein IPM50_05490 [Acidobacteriota bacterium]
MKPRSVGSVVDEIAADKAAWLPDLYKTLVRKQRTRAVGILIPAKQNSPEIIYTLLGIELRVGRSRFACPDLATARYMRIFARIGCGDFAIPYDITRVSAVADKMETAWHHSMLRMEMLIAEMPLSTAKRVRTSAVKRMRDEIAEIGPGEMMPEFIK